MRERGELQRRGSPPGRGCTNERFCNDPARTCFQGLRRCEKVLQNQCVLQYLYAMLIGYARVSTDDQDTAAQVAALQAAGCERIFREKASGGRWERPQFLRLLNQLRTGDVVVVWKLDRLSRSLRDVLTIMEQLGEAGAGFRSLTEAIDTTTPAGRMMMQMVGAFAEFERAMLRERTQAGLDTARQEGRVGGRRPKLSPRITRWRRAGIPPQRGSSHNALRYPTADSLPPPSRAGSWSPTRLTEPASTDRSGHYFLSFPQPFSAPRTLTTGTAPRASAMSPQARLRHARLLHHGDHDTLRY